MNDKVLIIGAGPAGLTAALELARRSDLRPIVLEALDDVGGISRTIEYRGNRMDIGGHRFFSKNDWVMNWWRNLMPVAPESDSDGLSLIPVDAKYLLVRSRLSRIYFLRRFFDYPISLSVRTMHNLGLSRLLRIGASYTRARLFPRMPERHLEDFFCNRFGSELYKIFFRDYTEKVWGVACSKISPAWGAQRIKGLSISKALVHAAKNLVGFRARGVAQKDTETSLIERFLYPKYGPGQMWRIAADELRSLGGVVHFGQSVTNLHLDGNRVVRLVTETSSGEKHEWQPDWVISTMPVKDLVQAVEPVASKRVCEVAAGLAYRDFMTMGLLLRRLKAKPDGKPPLNLLPDTWIYIQEPDVKIGRLQIFNNWSPALVAKNDCVWMGLEYFCQEGDSLWTMDDASFAAMGIEELSKIDIIDPSDVLDWHIVRVPKAYPAYFGTYDQFDEIRQWADGISNLFLVGRNGMHRYNNQDHSMITAKLAVDAILDENIDKSAIWNVNIEEEYHEERVGSKT